MVWECPSLVILGFVPSPTRATVQSQGEGGLYNQFVVEITEFLVSHPSSASGLGIQNPFVDPPVVGRDQIRQQLDALVGQVPPEVDFMLRSSILVTKIEQHGLFDCKVPGQLTLTKLE